MRLLFSSKVCGYFTPGIIFPMQNLDGINTGRHGFKETFGAEQVGYGLPGCCLFIITPSNSRHAIRIDSPGMVTVFKNILNCRYHSQELADIDCPFTKLMMEKNFASLQIDCPVFSHTVLEGMGAIGRDSFCWTVSGRRNHRSAFAESVRRHGL